MPKNRHRRQKQLEGGPSARLLDKQSHEEHARRERQCQMMDTCLTRFFNSARQEAQFQGFMRIHSEVHVNGLMTRDEFASGVLGHIIVRRGGKESPWDGLCAFNGDKFESVEDELLFSSAEAKHLERFVDDLITSPELFKDFSSCLLYTSPSPRDQRGSRMPSSA